jgi:hypothetical protein
LNYWNIRDFSNSTVQYLISLKTLDQEIRIPANAFTLNRLFVPGFQFLLRIDDNFREFLSDLLGLGCGLSLTDFQDAFVPDGIGRSVPPGCSGNQKKVRVSLHAKAVIILTTSGSF